MEDINSINSQTKDVFEVAMSESYTRAGTYFIFRSKVCQIVIVEFSEWFTSTHTLNEQEINHIKEHYKHLNTDDYRVFKK